MAARIQRFETIPYASQFASPELIEALAEKKLDPRLDPRWAESGADTAEEYAYWCTRACGVACVKMIVEALGGPEQSLVAWAQAGAAAGGYLSELRPDGSSAERGWLHSALADLIRAQGFWAEPRAATLADFPDYLRQGVLLIASASYEIGSSRPVTRKGGHLVVVYGIELEQDAVSMVILNNPSGRTEALRGGARIPAGRFAEAFSGRVILAGKAPRD